MHLGPICTAYFLSLASEPIMSENAVAQHKADASGSQCGGRWAAEVLGEWLYLGGARDASNLTQLREHRISALYTYIADLSGRFGIAVAFSEIAVGLCRLALRGLFTLRLALVPSPHLLAHVLNVSDDVPNYFETDNCLKYLKLNVKDFGEDAGICRVFEAAFMCAPSPCRPLLAIGHRFLI